MQRGEIYLVDLDANNVGSEQSGIRPALIVQSETGNMYSPTTIICPLTSAEKSPQATHVLLRPEDGVAKSSTVLCEQVRVIDKTRIRKKLGEIQNVLILEDINRKLMVSLGICTGGSNE